MKKQDRTLVRQINVTFNPLSVICPKCKAAQTARCTFKIRDGHRFSDIPHAERILAAQQREDATQHKNNGFSRNQIERQLNQLLEHSSVIAKKKEEEDKCRQEAVNQAPK
jgi:hypothetical protein